MELKDKISIITGGGRGIGKATAKLFSDNGSKIIIVSRTLSELEQTADEISSCGGECEYMQLDLSKESEIETLYRYVLDKYKKIDILINNAAVFKVVPIVDSKTEDYDFMMNINLKSVYLMCREALKVMTKQKSGNIVNISSIAGIYGPKKFKGSGIYVASKYGVIGLTEVLAIEGKKFGIRVNCVSPGSVNTTMLTNNLPTLKPDMEPTEVANTVLFLASDKSKAISGRNIEIFDVFG